MQKRFEGKTCRHHRRQRRHRRGDGQALRRTKVRRVVVSAIDPRVEEVAAGLKAAAPRSRQMRWT